MAVYPMKWTLWQCAVKVEDDKGSNLPQTVQFARMKESCIITTSKSITSGLILQSGQPFYMVRQLTWRYSLVKRALGSYSGYESAGLLLFSSYERAGLFTHYGHVAQQEEQSAVNRCVVGSRPTLSVSPFLGAISFGEQISGYLGGEIRHYGQLAQLVEHWIENPGRASSILALSIQPHNLQTDNWARKSYCLVALPLIRVASAQSINRQR